MAPPSTHRDATSWWLAVAACVIELASPHPAELSRPASASSPRELPERAAHVGPLIHLVVEPALQAGVVVDDVLAVLLALEIAHRQVHHDRSRGVAGDRAVLHVVVRQRAAVRVLALGARDLRNRELLLHHADSRER